MGAHSLFHARQRQQPAVPSCIPHPTHSGQSATEDSVERGNVSDLLILRSNPLSAVCRAQKIGAALNSGECYSRSDLDALLRQLEEKTAPCIRPQTTVSSCAC
jgi:hypothetical protein